MMVKEGGHSVMEAPMVDALVQATEDYKKLF